MPNLINTDSAGNVFYNYFTPAVKGETGANYSTIVANIQTVMRQKWGGTDYAQSSGGLLYFRPLAPGLESKTGSVAIATNRRAQLMIHGSGSSFILYTSTNITSSNNIFTFRDYTVNTSDAYFMVVNDYSFVMASLTAVGGISTFIYAGYLRESSYNSTSIAPMGFVILASYAGSVYLRPAGVNGTTNASFSWSADAITSPPIVCTPGTDPGDGSETFTDVVIRDAAAPNNPVGKLWNCIDMPASCNVGELWKNVGAYDGDGVASDQDVYLCVMPWGTRKLGMRVWTENVF